MTEVQNKKLIKYSWEFENYSGKSTSAFELFEQDNSTKKRLTTNILEDFPEDITEFRRESCIEGWEYFIKNKLTEYLRNNYITNNLRTDESVTTI